MDAAKLNQAVPGGQSIARDLMVAAVEHRVVFDSGCATPEELARIAAWLESDPRHEQAWGALHSAIACVDHYPPGVLRSTLLKPKNSGRRRALGVLGLSALFGSGAIALSEVFDAGQAQTATGEIRTLALAGGRVTLALDTHSLVEGMPDPSFLRLREGRVLIRQEGCAGSCLPCVVACAGLRVESAGGVFSLRRSDDVVRVVAMNGRLDLFSPVFGQSTLMSGQVGVVAAGDWWIEEMRLSDGPEWVDGSLVTEGSSLGQVLSELDRYRHGWTQCPAPLARLPVAGVFSLLDYPSSLQLLEDSLPIRAVRWGGVLTRIYPA